jgi:hypothetical protein
VAFPRPTLALPRPAAAAPPAPRPSEFADRHHAACRRAVAAAAQLDALCALAATASAPGYVRPAFVDEGAAPRLFVAGGRHPTLDLALAPGGAVPNDVHLAWDGARAAVVTGARWGRARGGRGRGRHLGP